MSVPKYRPIGKPIFIFSHKYKMHRVLWPSTLLILALLLSYKRRQERLFLLYVWARYWHRSPFATLRCEEKAISGASLHQKAVLCVV